MAQIHLRRRRYQVEEPEVLPAFRSDALGSEQPLVEKRHVGRVVMNDEPRRTGRPNSDRPARLPIRLYIAMC